MNNLSLSFKLIPLVLLGLLLYCPAESNAQTTYTRADSLRGSITPERAWWDLLHYDLKVSVDPSNKSIEGTNTITYRVTQRRETMQIDLQSPMELTGAMQDNQPLEIESEDNVHLIQLDKQTVGSEKKITLLFKGVPKEAVRPPWDGGITWQKDNNGNPFIASANQGIGSSVWWPGKDHPADEPDRGVDLSITVPSSLVAVGNGRLIDTKDHGNTKTWHWRVVNPISSYGININIGDYVNFSEVYQGLEGPLDMDYWVLRDHLEKAKKQFKEAPRLMKAFEHWFGPYPFYKDSFKLVEVPYLGMEHQSSVTYGNGYQNGYRGTDLSDSGWGLKFDFIIVHEAGHEWFANGITNKDVADMWIHEGFTAYSENLFLDYHFGKKASSEYVIGTRKWIKNEAPVIGNYEVDSPSPGVDIYYKGSNILHTLRQLIEDDEKWKNALTGLIQTYKNQTVTTDQVEQYLSKATSIDLTEFWQQYLRTTDVPTVEYRTKNNTLEFRYVNVIDQFDMPVIAIINGTEQWIYPTSEWKSKSLDATIESVRIKEDFYVFSKELQP